MSHSGMRPARGYRVSKQTLYVHGNIQIRLFNKALIKEVGKEVNPYIKYSGYQNRY